MVLGGDDQRQHRQLHAYLAQHVEPELRLFGQLEQILQRMGGNDKDKRNCYREGPLNSPAEAGRWKILKLSTAMDVRMTYAFARAREEGVAG